MASWPIPSESWDAWLAKQGGDAGFLQTGRWAAISHAVNGTEAQLIVVPGDEPAMPTAGALLLLVRSERGLELVCHEGPVLPMSSAEDALDTLLEEIGQFAAGVGAVTVRFTGGPPTADWLRASWVTAAFERQGYRCRPWETSLVDVGRSDEELMSSVRQAARKAVRRCHELGITVVECRTLSDYEQLYLDPHRLPHEGGRELWAIDGGEHYRFFSALDPGGVVLATLGSYRFNGVATEIESRRTTAGLDHRAPAQDLLHWELFRAHRDDGDALVNLAGFAANPSNSKEAGIRRFKEKWGGRTVPLLVCELDRRSYVTRVVNAGVRRARRALRRSVESS
jgi:hypothetical protein